MHHEDNTRQVIEQFNAAFNRHDVDAVGVSAVSGGVGGVGVSGDVIRCSRHH